MAFLAYNTKNPQNFFQYDNPEIWQKDGQVVMFIVDVDKKALKSVIFGDVYQFLLNVNNNALKVFGRPRRLISGNRIIVDVVKSGKDLRKFPRLDVSALNIKVEIRFLKYRFEAKLLDFSLGGARFQFDPPAFEQFLLYYYNYYLPRKELPPWEIDIFIPGGGRFTVKAHPVRVNEDRKTAAVVFDPEQDRKTILKLYDLLTKMLKSEGPLSNNQKGAGYGSSE